MKSIYDRAVEIADEKMMYLFKVGDKKYNFYFLHIGTDYWNMNWVVFIKNVDDEKDWEYHKLSKAICKREFSPAEPYEWILQYANKRFRTNNFVIEKIY